MALPAILVHNNRLDDFLLVVRSEFSLLGALYITQTLAQRGVNFDLTIAGRGDLEPYRSDIDQLKVKIENGWISDQRFDELLLENDIVVLPYREASQSGVAGNALNAALPVIATPVGGLAECISHNLNGLVTSQVTSDAIADSLESILVNPILYEKLSQGAHESAKLLTPKATSKMWLEYYQRTIKHSISE
jgi:glycosyltransferase involved in cell wall biosynthesis